MKLARLTTLTAQLRGDHIETRTRLWDVKANSYKDMLQRPLMQGLCQLPESEIATDLFAYGEDTGREHPVHIEVCSALSCFQKCELFQLDWKTLDINAVIIIIILLLYLQTFLKMAVSIQFADVNSACLLPKLDIRGKPSVTKKSFKLISQWKLTCQRFGWN